MAKKPEKIEEKKEKRVYQQYQLEGFSSIILCEITEISLVVRRKYRHKQKEKQIIMSKKEVSSESRILERYKLNKISVDELEVLRESKEPTLIIKNDGKYYYAKVKADTRLGTSNFMGNHQCSYMNHQCEYLLASLGEEGCRKVYDADNKLENYDFITSGYELLNTEIEEFVVTGCSNCKIGDAQKSRKMSKEETEKLFSDLEDLLELFRDREEVNCSCLSQIFK